MSFIKNGNSYTYTESALLDIREHLPSGLFVVKEDKRTEQLFLNEIPMFRIPSHRYGDNDEMADRIINTFLDREKSTGVLLSGEGGTGKTLLAKTVSLFCASHQGIPTIVVNECFYGDDFSSFIQDINQDCIVLFDEFEKIYDKREEQKHILTLLDGVYQTKKLFILTCNDHFNINRSIQNRPGRIYYHLYYESIESQAVEELLNEKLLNKNYKEQIKMIVSLYSQFSFDMLNALIEEVNRYGESPDIAIQYLNISKIYDPCDDYSISIKNEIGVDITNELVNKKGLIDPSSVDSSIDIMFNNESNRESFVISINDLILFNKENQSYVYKKNEYTITLTRVRNDDYIYPSAFGGMKWG